MTLVQMPMLTHFLGHVVDAGTGSAPTSFLNQLSITKGLIKQLPQAAHVYIKHHRGITNTVAFQAMGFLTDVQYTSEIAPAPHDVLWSGMRDKTRNVIRRGEERFEVAELSDPHAFTALYEAHLSEKRLDNYYDPAISSGLISECLKRDAGRVLGARDREGALAAAIFCVWDDVAEYYLMTTRGRAAGNGAVSVLLWNAIKHAAARNLTFDFDGIQGLGDAHFFTGFGGVMQPRLISYRNSRAYKIVDRFRPQR